MVPKLELGIVPVHGKTVWFLQNEHGSPRLATGILQIRDRIDRQGPRGLTLQMELRYLETAQPVPGQGMSYTLYEVEGEDTIVRMLTSLPQVGKISRYPKPPVKKLFAPERCEQIAAERFLELWEQGAPSGG